MKQFSVIYSHSWALLYLDTFTPYNIPERLCKYRNMPALFLKVSEHAGTFVQVSEPNIARYFCASIRTRSICTPMDGITLRRLTRNSANTRAIFIVCRVDLWKHLIYIPEGFSDVHSGISSLALRFIISSCSLCTQS